MNRIVLLSLLWCIKLSGATPLPFAVLPETRSFKDTIPPVITCPPNDTVTVAPGFCTAVVNYSVAFSDNLPGANLIQATGMPSGSHFPLGNTLNLFVAVDAAGNTSTCGFTVTVKDLTPTLLCTDLYHARLDSNCTVSLSADQLLEGVVYGCLSNFVVEVDKIAPFGNGPWVPAQLGIADLNKTYQFRVSSLASGNRCWGNVKVVDSIKPYLSCSSITLSCAAPSVAPAFLKDSLGIAAGMPVPADNCAGTINLTYLNTQQNVPCDSASNGYRKLTIRTWTATDVAGNKSVCTQTIAQAFRYQDIKFPPDITVSTCETTNVPESVSGKPYFKAGNRLYPVEQATFCKAEVNYYDTIEPVADCPSYKRIRRTWKIFDLCSNQPANNAFISTQYIDIQDQTGPVIQCTPDVTVTVPALSCSPTVDFPDFVVTDNCSRLKTITAKWAGHGGAVQTLAGHLTDFPANDPVKLDTLGVFDTIPDFTLGITSVTYIATDECGNTGSCSFNLHVWDQVPPVAACLPGATVYLAQNGKALLHAAALDDGSQDDCNGVTFKARLKSSNPCQPIDHLYDDVALCCAFAGDTVQVTLRVYDVETAAGSILPGYGAGHYSECDVPVVVRDTFPPGCAAPANVHLNCEDFNPALPFGAPAAIGCKTDSLSLFSVDYTQYDTICRRGIITRMFQSFQHGIAGAKCSQTITIDHKQEYNLKLPDDVIATTCNGTNDYGKPIFNGVNCERMQFSFTDEIFAVVPDACYKIERTWKVYNGCTYDTAKALVFIPNPTPNAISNHQSNLPGPIVSAPATPTPWASTVVKINPADPTATNYSTFWAAAANGYTYKQIIKVIDTKPPVVQCPSSPVIMCDSTVNDPNLWNEPYWFDPVTSSQDLCDGPVNLTMTGTDLCSGSDISIRYLLFMDLDGDGTFETVVPSTNPPGYGIVSFNNAGNPNYSGGTARTFDGRPVQANQLYAFTMQTTVSGNKKTASVRWNTQQSPGAYVMPQLPYGTHKIKWILTDNCGNDQACEYTFVVKDCLPPTVACVNGLSVSILPDGKAPLLQDTDILLLKLDNCTPADQLQLSMRQSGQGTGFPLDAQLKPIHSIGLTCADKGNKTIELWAKDKAGNANYCTAEVLVEDNNNYCVDLVPLAVQGKISTEVPDGVSGVTVRLNVQPYLDLPVTETSLTDAMGAYAFLAQIPPYGDYVVTPKKNDGALNGVSTYDLVLISKHILGQLPLGSPYRIIAADANKNGSVTAADIVEIRKLILGIYDTFPHTTSWRFVDKEFVFPDQNNPFKTVFPETIHGNNNTPSLFKGAFVAVKTGDVNDSAMPNVAAAADERGSGGSVMVDVDPTPRGIGAQPIPSLPSAREQGGFIGVPVGDGVDIGDLFWVRFGVAERLLGYQYTMQLDGVEVVDLVPGDGMTMGHFGVFGDAVTVSYDGVGAGDFRVRFRALKPGHWRDMLHVSDRITRAEAYRADGKAVDIAFRFGGSEVQARGMELYQNIPNPVESKTSIGFYLPDACRATLTVSDAGGKVLFERRADYDKGLHYELFDAEKVGASGVLMYKLEAPGGVLTRKMVKK